jgi:2-polyprenyl-6-methoxyphenol hydroxylase-like FAD-dependent oxidoreductase
VDAEVVIVGGGIAGLATALALRRAGVARGGGVLVLERHAELRATGAALTIFPNGWFALRALGVAHKLTSRYQAYETCVACLTGEVKLNSRSIRRVCSTEFSS